MYDKIVEIIKKYSEVEFTEDTLLKDIGIDSLQVIEILLDLEDELDVSIPDNDQTPLFSIKDLVEYIQKIKEEA